ncbi:hypothetical protein BRC92_03070 [Halobacteriales archaeon QS_4_69_31]|nr:MAG: hypothetical protein BRC92_03070 [Halobacteriales archaeon QS_4_69_31]
MSIKCSLLGHDFGETAVEREREEDGSEVVITITELETCTRCGETRVVSENKEVTTMETPDDARQGGGSGADAGGTSPSTGGTGSSSGSGADYDPDGDDAEILDDDGGETDAQAQARGATIPDAAADAPADADPDPEDDAVIIDGDAPAEAGDDATGDGATGEWPEETEADGDVAGDPMDEWPEETEATGDVAGDPMDEWPEETKRDAGGDAAAAGPTLDETASPTVTVPEGIFKCSECEFTTEVESSSLRAGDFCPECHRGTLVQHEDADAA